MPNFAFQPLIGSSFDNLAGQQFQWANYNRSVEEGNRAAAERADQTQNNYLAQVAQMRQRAQDQEMQMQLAADQSAKAAAATAVANAEDTRRFGINTRLEQEKVANEADRYQFAQKQHDKAEQDYVDQTVNTAKALAPDVSKTRAALESAQSDYNDARKSAAIRAAELQRELKDVPGGVGYNPKTNQLVPLGKGLMPEHRAKIADANDELATLAGDNSAIARKYAEAIDSWKTIEQKAGKEMFPQQRDGKWGLYVPHPRVNKFFTDETAPAVEPDAPDETDTAAPDLPFWARPPSIDLGQPVNLGGSMGEISQPANAFKVGRFMVTPQ